MYDKNEMWDTGRLDTGRMKCRIRMKYRILDNWYWKNKMSGKMKCNILENWILET